MYWRGRLPCTHYRFQLRGDLLFWQFPEIDGWIRAEPGHNGFQHATYFFSKNSLMAKNRNFRVLSLARNVKHGADCIQTKQFPRSRLGLRSVIHSSAPTNLPIRSVPLPEGSVYEVVAYCTMSQFLALGGNCKTLNFLFFLQVYTMKN